MKDYYKILEVEEKASQQDIKKSYRTLSKKYHPDVNPEGGEQFKDIAEAYDVIGNAEKRVQYDQNKNNPFAGNGNSSFEEMFNQMFNRGNAQRTRRKSVPDKILKVQINPIESYQGIEKKLQYLKDTQCGGCGGNGGQQQTCVTCNGAGFQIRTFGTGFMVQQIRQSCTSCGGRGYTLVHKCQTCNGHGTKSEMSTVNFKLPKGVDSGQFLKLENFGDFRNGEIGDLVIQIELVEKDGFEKMNNDITVGFIIKHRPIPFFDQSKRWSNTINRYLIDETVLSLKNYDNNEFVGRLGVGNPPQYLDVVFDTGKLTLALLSC